MLWTSNVTVVVSPAAGEVSATFTSSAVRSGAPAARSRAAAEAPDRSILQSRTSFGITARNASRSFLPSTAIPSMFPWKSFETRSGIGIGGTIGTAPVSETKTSVMEPYIASFASFSDLTLNLLGPKMNKATTASPLQQVRGNNITTCSILIPRSRPHKALYNRWKRWRDRGVFARIMAGLAAAHGARKGGRRH